MGTQTSTILPLSMASDHLRPSAYGLVMGIAGLVIVLGQLFVPGLIAGRSKPHILAAANGFVAAGTALVALAHAIPLYLAAALIWTVGQMLGAPPNAATIAELASTNLRARYQAVFYLSFPLAGFIAPAIGGATLQWLGHWHWVLWGAIGAAAAIGHLLAAPARERQAARLRAKEAIQVYEDDGAGVGVPK
jgi:MFS family permease